MASDQYRVHRHAILPVGRRTARRVSQESSGSRSVHLTHPVSSTRPKQRRVFNAGGKWRVHWLGNTPIGISSGSHEPYSAHGWQAKRRTVGIYRLGDYEGHPACRSAIQGFSGAHFKVTLVHHWVAKRFPDGVLCGSADPWSVEYSKNDDFASARWSFTMTWNDPES